CRATGDQLAQLDRTLPCVGAPALNAGARQRETQQRDEQPTVHRTPSDGAQSAYAAAPPSVTVLRETVRGPGQDASSEGVTARGEGLRPQLWAAREVRGRARRARLGLRLVWGISMFTVGFVLAAVGRVALGARLEPHVAAAVDLALLALPALLTLPLAGRLE